MDKKKVMTDSHNLLVFGSSTWARTRDKRINSPLLYQLSYRGIVLFVKALTLIGGGMLPIWSLSVNSYYMITVVFI